ncbi:hypothetical protein B0T22DRAFT_452597 [Podospora appendiculata]|uniref:Uncharacterized protein n=1 Tax=Podospora appendiculata TaxID=314037 RepID=A0AAE1CHF9_9PEZI|nr:hypothetical protein B0T22DRAFT_452597 [Podospora appendiculata]
MALCHYYGGPQYGVSEFRFALELGLVLRSRRQTHYSLRGLLHELSDRLRHRGVVHHYLLPGQAYRENDRIWTVVGDDTLPSSPHENTRFGIRLVSPYFIFRDFSRWMHQVQDVFRVLYEDDFETTATHQCFTYVHIVPCRGYWHLRELKALAKFILHYEACLDALMPVYRQRSILCKSNRWNDWFRGRPNSRDAFADVDRSMASVKDLAFYMNVCGPHSATATALPHMRHMPAGAAHNTFRWSFTNLIMERSTGSRLTGFGTVVFRQPPAASSATEAMRWVLLVGCFAQLSRTHADALDPNGGASLKRLGECLLYQARCCGAPHRSLLKSMFDQAVPPAQRRSAAAALEYELVGPARIQPHEQEKLRHMELQKDIAADKYKIFAMRQCP